MNEKSQAEAARRARLLKSRAERLPNIKKQFEENQKRNFNANFAPGGKDEKLVRGKKTTTKATTAKKATKTTAPKAKKATKSENPGNEKRRDVNLLVSTRKGEMVHHQRMLSQDVNAQATQHIIGIPVNKSRYNGYHGNQVTQSQIRAARPRKEAVRIIPIGGLGETGIGKNMTAIEYQGEIILVDMGTLFADNDYPGVNYMIPASKYLEDNRDNIKAILFTHAHLDHIGACKHLLPYFGPLVPIYATPFTIGMIKRQMSELTDVPEMNYQPVNPLDHKKIQLSQHLSCEFIHMLHSIPGNTSIVVRTPNGNIVLSGDWRFETNPMDTPADYDHLVDIANTEGIAVLLNESTNIDTPGTHPHSEYDVGDNMGKVMDNYASGRVIISCFSSQVKRI